MLVELGNHACALVGLDERPKVTAVEIPDYDDGSTHDDAVYDVGGEHRTLASLERSLPDGAVLIEPGPRLGGHSHDPGELTAAQFKDHISDARLFNQGITQLPGHEALLAVEAAWPKNGHGRPTWVKVHPGLRSDEHAADLERVLSDFYEIPTLEGYYSDADTVDAHHRKELEHWTRNGPPGVNRGLVLPDLQAVYTNDGRAMNNENDGGDSLTALGVVSGVGTGSTATTLTGCTGLTVNGLAGHRVYVHTTSGPAFVWGNVISNTAIAITVDQWYVPATPSGSAGTNPATDFAFVVVDGGMVSTWFSAIGTGGSGWAAGDHTIAVSSGSVEYTQAGGTMIRKQCPVAVTSGVAARTVTLVPVFTANASDVANLPKVISVVGFFASMVPGFGGAGGPMKFIDAISPTATLAALNDQLTVTEVITGS
jgi:hypothetical protein